MPNATHPQRRREPNRRDRWKRAVQKARVLSPGTRLFLVATLAAHMDARGLVCYPRARLAAEAGVTPRQVTNYIKAAKEAGWLVVSKPGYRTHTAEYEATFPDVKGEILTSLNSEGERGNSTNPLCAGKIVPPLRAIGGNLEFPPVVPIGTRRGTVLVSCNYGRNSVAVSARKSKAIHERNRRTPARSLHTSRRQPVAVMDGFERGE